MPLSLPGHTLSKNAGIFPHVQMLEGSVLNRIGENVSTYYENLHDSSSYFAPDPSNLPEIFTSASDQRPLRNHSAGYNGGRRLI
jgi:hypothetical protein